jgi:hypothetical protein
MKARRYDLSRIFLCSCLNPMPFGNSIVGDWPENRLLREPLDATGNRGSGIWRQPAQVPRPAPDSALRSRFPVCRVRRGARKVRFRSPFPGRFRAVTNFRKALSFNPAIDGLNSARGPGEVLEGREAEPSRRAKRAGVGSPRASKEAPAARARRWKDARQSRAAEREASGGGVPASIKGGACGPREALEGREAEPSRRARSERGWGPREH